MEKNVEAPSVFVRKDKSISALTTKKDYHHDDPLFWHQKRYTHSAISYLRQQLDSTKDSNLASIQEIAMAQEAPLLSIQTAQKKAGEHDLDTGKIGSFSSAKITLLDNPKIDKRLEKAFYDEATATQAIAELQKKEVSEYSIVKLFSVAGLGKKRLVVPTRNSITAVDDILCKKLQEEIKDNTQANISVFTSEYLGNEFVIIFLSGAFSYEFIEMGNSFISVDRENTRARTTYAQQTAGAYYAAKLPVLEYLKENKRQSSVVVIRYIAPSYTESVGVWVIRESIRAALAKKPIIFSDHSLLHTFMQHYAKKYLYHPYVTIKQKSSLLGSTQTLL